MPSSRKKVSQYNHEKMLEKIEALKKRIQKENKIKSNDGQLDIDDIEKELGV